MRLGVGRLAIEVSEQFASLASSRCALAPFESARSDAVLQLRGASGSPPEDAKALGEGAYTLSGAELDVWLPGDPFSAEAAIRLAFAIAFDRQGGLLIHSAGIAFPEGAWLAVGPSGAGKSTLAQHCADAGAEILSDESVGWLPDGTLWPTPFRSTARFTRSGPSSSRPLSVLAFLEHGTTERLEPIDAPDAVRRLLPQAYRTPGAPVLHRVSTLASQRGAHRFLLRDHPDVAAFMRRPYS